MKHINSLTDQEYQDLLKFPVYVSLLASTSEGKMDNAEKKSAVEFAHIKTFSCDPVLKDFYHDAEKVFEKNMLEIDNQLPAENSSRVAAIKDELSKLQNILKKTGQKFQSTMQRSMKSFKDHVSKAHHNVLVDFIFPIPIHGLSD